MFSFVIFFLFVFLSVQDFLDSAKKDFEDRWSKNDKVRLKRRFYFVRDSNSSCYVDDDDVARVITVLCFPFVKKDSLFWSQGHCWRHSLNSCQFVTKRLILYELWQSYKLEVTLKDLFFRMENKSYHFLFD